MSSGPRLLFHPSLHPDFACSQSLLTAGDPKSQVVHDVTVYASTTFWEHDRICFFNSS